MKLNTFDLVNIFFLTKINLFDFVKFYFFNKLNVFDLVEKKIIKKLNVFGLMFKGRGTDYIENWFDQHFYDKTQCIWFGKKNY